MSQQTNGRDEEFFFGDGDFCSNDKNQENLVEDEILVSSEEQPEKI